MTERKHVGPACCWSCSQEIIRQLEIKQGQYMLLPHTLATLRGKKIFITLYVINENHTCTDAYTYVHVYTQTHAFKHARHSTSEEGPTV